MAKGASIKFNSYEETVPKLLKLLRLDNELKKHESIVLKVQLSSSEEQSTQTEFVESALSFIMKNKNPVTNVFIAEGSDGEDTEALFESQGFQELADKHGIGLIDLNNTETSPIESPNFIKFNTIYYPTILSKSFVITLTKLEENAETGLNGALASMLGTFPAKHYQGFFSTYKNKIRKFPIKYSIHDILRCKFPDFSIVDASEFGTIIAGLPQEIDKQSTKFLNLEVKEVPYLKLLEESSIDFSKQKSSEAKKDELDEIIHSNY